MRVISLTPEESVTGNDWLNSSEHTNILWRQSGHTRQSGQSEISAFAIVRTSKRLETTLSFFVSRP